MKSLTVSLLFACVLLASIEEIAAQGKKVVCYYGTWAVYRPGDGMFDVENIPINLCTHIIYGFTDLGSDNRIALYDPWNDIVDPSQGGGRGALLRFTGLKKQNPNLKTLVANGGWNAGSNKYSRMAAVPAERAKFVSSVVDFVRQYNFDGFDFDWEYPSCKADGDEDRICAPSSDKANYASLMRELKTALSPYGYMLTAAVHCGKNTIDYGYDIPTLTNVLDQFHVMTYDYHGAWERVTGHNAPLYANPSFEFGNETWLNANWTISYWMANGVPASKIIMGAAVYGRGVTLTDPNQNGLLAPNNGPIPEGPWTRQNGTWGYHEICTAQKEGGWTVVRDPCYQAPYAYKNNLWIGYDDVESLTVKGQYISAMQLGGVMIWEIDTDDFKGKCFGEEFVLTKAVIKAINTPATLPPQCTDFKTTTPARPTCPSNVPTGFSCECNDKECILILTTTTASTMRTTPSCPSLIPDGFICVCNAVSCELIQTTTTSTTTMSTIRTTPSCPSLIPDGFICVCNAVSCELIQTTTTARPATTFTFSPTPTTTRNPSTEFDCSGKPNGNYPDPAGPCTGFFYMCSNGIAYLYDCAFQDLVFYPPTDKCEHRSDVYPCNIKI